METTLYKHAHGEWIIDYDPSVPCLIGRHVGFQSIEESKAFLNKALEFITEKKGPSGKMAWIGDISRGESFDIEFITWVVEVWNKRALEAGVRHVALVMPEDEYSLASMNGQVYLEETGSKEEIVSRNFKDMESAKTWLREVLNAE